MSLLPKIKKKNNANICTKSEEQIFSQKMAKGTVCFYAQMDITLDLCCASLVVY